MGRNSAIGWLPHYREVLVAKSVRTVRDSFPAAQSFAVPRRGWLADSAAQAGWRAVAVAAGAVPDHTISR